MLCHVMILCHVISCCVFMSFCHFRLFWYYVLYCSWERGRAIWERGFIAIRFIITVQKIVNSGYFSQWPEKNEQFQLPKVAGRILPEILKDTRR